jgi:thiamine biosynthesis lipoprotein
MAAALTRRQVIRQAKGLALATPFLSLIACEGGAGRLTQVSGATMGTTYRVKIHDLPAGTSERDLERDVARILATVDARMSTYRANSELSRFNDGPADAWTEVSHDTLAVVEAALGVSRLTSGAFDPTIGPLVDLWGFGAGGQVHKVPAPAQIEAARRRMSFADLRAATTPPRLGKKHGGTRLDLSGIAKGFGADKVAEHLERLGAGQYLVEVGGELRGRGASPRGEVWRVGIERPVAAPRAVQRVVRLGGQGLATSGDYRIFFEHDGATYAHLIDPRSGRPVDHGLASVTVIAGTTMWADALSTALMVLGPEAGRELAEREGIAAFFIARHPRGFVEIATPAFAPYLAV